MRSPAWLDDRLVSAEAAALAGAEAIQPGCYTTARVRAGEALYARRHVLRLQRDAAALGLEPPHADRVLAALAALAEAAFGDGCGIVRLDVGRDATGGSLLSGRTRPLGPEPPVWSAVTAPFPHAGPGPAPGAKLADAALTARARDFAAAAAADEALLFDSEGHLVEAARSNVFVIDAAGHLLAPGPSRGAVNGIAREILCEQLTASSALAAEGTDEDLDPDDLRRAREIIAVNAVRGVRPVVSLDGAPVATGSPGPWAARLAALLALQEPPRRAR